MKIRTMLGRDLQVLQEVIHSIGVFTAEEERVAFEMIETYLTQPDQQDYTVDIVEDDAGVAVGFVCYGPTPLTEGTLDLYWIVIHSGKHKQGFGKVLLNWVEKTAIERKMRLILIETSSSAKYGSTRHFYEHMGYLETARIRDFYRPGDDRIIYSKYLHFDNG